MKLQKVVFGILFIMCGISAQEPKTKINEENKIKAAKKEEPKLPLSKPYAVDKSFVVRKIDIGIKGDDRVEIINSLRSLLADSYLLYTKALNFHWNVEGGHFSYLHRLFKKVYENLQNANDLLAERIRALGGYAPGSMQEFLTLTQLKENLGRKLYYRQMLQIALDDHETIIRSMRKATELSAQYDDWATNNMLASLLEKLEKLAWMIRAHLADEKTNNF